MKRLTIALTGLILLSVFATTAQAVTIETVPVGNLGNAGDDEVMPDGTTGYGSVDYAYNIGKYEVTAGLYCEFLNAVAGVDAYGLYNSSMWYKYGCKIERFDGSGTLVDPYQYRVAADRTNRPVNYVSWADAARFANWLHNGQGNGDTENGAYNLSGTHPYYNPDGSINDYPGLNAALIAVTRESDWQWSIPSEDEWYKAAFHKNNGDTDDYFDYPTSSDSKPSNDLINPDPGNNATFYDSGLTIGSPYYQTEVGAHENSESPYDTFDQGGNVFEWNDAVIGSRRGVRGGHWDHGYYDLLASSRNEGTPTAEIADIGFRLASVPEPGTITLLLCGLASLICYRRRK